MLVKITETRNGHIPRIHNYDLLGRSQFTIGRSLETDCPVMLDDLRCSRVQATIVYRDGNWWLVDGKEGTPSSNGLWINGQRLTTQLEIKVGLKAILYQTSESKVEAEFSQSPNCERDTDSFDYIDLLRKEISQLRIEINLSNQSCEERIIALSEEVRNGNVVALHQQIEDLSQKVAELEGIESTILELINSEISQVRDLFSKEFGQMHKELISLSDGLRRNVDQDAHQNLLIADHSTQITTQRDLYQKIITALSGAFILIALYVGTGGDREFITKVLPWVGSLVGGGAVAKVAYDLGTSKSDTDKE